MRASAAVLLTALLVAVVSAQPAGLGQPPAAAQPKDPPKDPKDTEPSKQPTPVPKPEWPREIGGKDFAAWLKEVSHPDPSVREFALKTLPSFGPDAKNKTSSKVFIKRMAFPVSGGEKDPGVRITLFN